MKANANGTPSEFAVPIDVSTLPSRGSPMRAPYSQGGWEDIAWITSQPRTPVSAMICTSTPTLTSTAASSSGVPVKAGRATSAQERGGDVSNAVNPASTSTSGMLGSNTSAGQERINTQNPIIASRAISPSRARSVAGELLSTREASCAAGSGLAWRANVTSANNAAGSDSANKLPLNPA